MDKVYTHKTRGMGYLARRAVTSDGQTDYDWFLVLIEGNEHARHRHDFIFDALNEPVTLWDFA